MINTDTNGSVVLLTDIQEWNQLCLNLLQLGSILLVGILQMLERTTWVNIVTWIYTNLLAVKCSHVGGMSSKMHIGHKWSVISVGLKLCRYILHVLSLAGALCSKTNQLSASIDNALCLSHTTLSIIGINSTHRLNADGVLSTYTDISHAGFG